jgi:hypothetical protein
VTHTTTLPTFLIPETETGKEASGHKQQDAAEPVELDGIDENRLLLTFGVVDTVEQQMVRVSIWTSADGKEWSKEPALTLPQKFYRGTWSYVLDLRGQPNVRYVQAKWDMEKWGRGRLFPKFKIYLFAEPL